MVAMSSGRTAATRPASSLFRRSTLSRPSRRSSAQVMIRGDASPS